MNAKFFFAFSDCAGVVSFTGTEVASYAFPVERVAVFFSAALLEKEFSVMAKYEQMDGAMEQVVAVDYIAALGTDFVIVFIYDGQKFGGICKVRIQRLKTLTQSRGDAEG